MEGAVSLRRLLLIPEDLASKPEEIAGFCCTFSGGQQLRLHGPLSTGVCYWMCMCISCKIYYIALANANHVIRTLMKPYNDLHTSLCWCK